jgi:hypothetical protein
MSIRKFGFALLALSLAGVTGSTAHAWDYTFHSNPHHSDYCIGGDCIAAFVPAYSDFLVAVLCNNQPPTPSNLWQINGETLFSPTCDWIDHQKKVRHVVVAFDDDGMAYFAPGWTSRLILDGAIPPLGNAQIFSNSYRNVQVGLPVYYSDFTPEAWNAMNTGWFLTPLDVYETEAACGLGVFEPAFGLRLALKDGRTVDHYSPACVAFDPERGDTTPYILFDATGRGYLMNPGLADRLAAAAQ